MKTRSMIKSVAMLMFAGHFVLAFPFSSAAQETMPEQKRQEGSMGRHGRGMEKESSMTMEKEEMPCMMTERHKMHEQMEKMHQEMAQALRQEMTALREHTQAMEGLSDEKQLVTEMKKHQQMTDELLSTMIAQREKMHAQMREHHEHMRSRMEKTQQTEKKEPAGHETHHEEE